MDDDLDTPNTKAGICPTCGQPANIWTPQFQEWECCYCNWTGRKPNPIQEKKDD